ncbi:Alpha/Beta hydrolase protein [Aspergillus pseudoustus]|uniref:Alpha/Beta hydrolase protein n=1 Tax=Aspergillus pseudoustus TaxID=1810923 RepID=A0ABR4KZ06_9EURO
MAHTVCLERQRMLSYRSDPPTTSGVYEQFVSSKGITKAVELTDDGVKVMWLSTPEHRRGKVLMYFHGGAYVKAALSGHLEIVHSQAERCKPRLAVCVVEYTLAPTECHPFQLQQAVSAIHHLQRVKKIKPSEIILAGDSAGGNLVAAVLLHSTLSHPRVTPLDLEEDNLAGAFLISPWVTFSLGSPSMTRNFYGDYLDPKALSRAALQFVNGNEDSHSTLLKAAPESWKEIKTKDTAIVAGECEMMVDDIVQFADNLMEHNHKVALYIAAKEAHVQMVLNRSLKRGKSESEKYFERWLDDRLEG